MATTSTTINEVTVTGRVYRRLIDKAAKLWQRISYWTKACDVEFDDGKTAQAKLGDINGITSDAELINEDIASSILPVHDVTVKANKIKENLDKGIINDRIQLVIDNNGKLAWKKDGADTVIPFNTGKTESGITDGDLPQSISVTLEVDDRDDIGGYAALYLPPKVWPYVILPAGMTLNGNTSEKWTITRKVANPGNCILRQTQNWGSDNGYSTTAIFTKT